MAEHKTRFLVVPACSCGWRGEEKTGARAENDALMAHAAHVRECRQKGG